MDTITILDIAANGTPNNVLSIAPTSTLTDNLGNTYPMLSGKGIESSKGFVIPESGKGTFQLMFPPLTPKAKWIDFTEGAEVEDGYTISGIQLQDMPALESLLHKDILTPKTNKSRSMDKQPFAFGKAAIKGKVDSLIGLKENVIIGKLIPAGTGSKAYRDVDYELQTEFMDEEPLEKLEEQFME
mgnify:CR=1 FL=1